MAPVYAWSLFSASCHPGGPPGDHRCVRNHPRVSCSIKSVATRPCFLTSWIGVLFSLVVATLYFTVKKALCLSRITVRWIDSFISMALQFGPIAEMSFEIDQRFVSTDPADIVGEQHIFVSGLARAGTTVLMRRFHATGQFRSLTYRDMPFVLAPNLWARLCAASKRDLDDAERAHGDNVLVNADSPESFDEVFWRVLDGAAYIRKDHLLPHDPDEETLDRFVSFVNAILTGRTPQFHRYLSKNNNNVLRLQAIENAFPNALILIPFREPLQHAYSLRRQHRRFVEMQTEDRFTRAYMTWLGHHEFGLDHRPFRFPDSVEREADTEDIDYWLITWCESYEWLLQTKPTQAVFVGYEDLCSDPDCWDRLTELAAVANTADRGDPFEESRYPIDDTPDPQLGKRAAEIYRELTEQARLVAVS